MSLIHFWDYGDGVAADVAAAFAVHHGLKRPGRLLLLNEQRAGEGMESGLKLYIDGQQKDAPCRVREHGIEALLRLQANHRLSVNNFRNYTYSLISGRLDVVSGFANDSGFHMDGWSEAAAAPGKSSVTAALYPLSMQLYEHTVVHSSRIQRARDTRTASELRIAVLTQNRVQLEKYFEEQGVDGASDLSSFNEILVLRDFDSSSRWTVNNIRRRYKAQVPILPLPYCTGFRDAANHRELLRFMYYYTSEPLGKRISNPFFSGLSKVCEQIGQQLSKGNLLPSVAGEEG